MIRNILPRRHCCTTITHGVQDAALRRSQALHMAYRSLHYAGRMRRSGQLDHAAYHLREAANWRMVAARASADLAAVIAQDQAFYQWGRDAAIAAIPLEQWELELLRAGTR